MFRKRTYAAAALVAALAGTVLTPATSSAQVLDLDDDDDVVDLDADEPKKKSGGSGVIDLDEGEAPRGPAAVAGQPSEAMARAKTAFDAKQWPVAAEGLYAVVAGETGDDAGNKQLAEFYLAQALYFLKFYQASFEGFTKIADNPSHLKFAESLMWLAKLATDMNEAADIISHVGKYQDDEIRRFDNANQKELYWKLNYLLGRYHYRQGNFPEAVRLFNMVNSESRDYVAAQFFTGVSYIQVRKSVEAVKAFQRVEKAVAEGAKVDDARRMRDLANLSMARTMYSASIQLDPETNAPSIREDALSTAVKYWNSVEEDSEYWLDAHFEEAWAYYMAGQYTRAMGNIHTLKSPYFPKAFYPEADILKAIIFFFNCDYESATTVVARFNTKTTPIKEKLEAILKKYKGENQEEAFYKLLIQVRDGDANIDEEVRPLVESALSDRELLRNVAYVNDLEKEQKHFKSSPGPFQGSGVGHYIEASTAEARTRAVKKAGALAMARYQRYVDEMGEHLRNGEKILIDITAAQRNLLDQAIKEGQVSATESKVFGVVNPDDEHFIWPFDGEYWRDELGFYRQVVQSACGR
jgi:tetratricopeptide (TPR) repeat protein